MNADNHLLSYPVASFVGDTCAGNPHCVVVNPRWRSPDERDAWLNKVDDSIFVALFTESLLAPRVEFYQSGRSILRCGSGTLAAAHVIFRKLGLGDDVLETPAGQVALKRDGEWLGYRAEALTIRAASQNPKWQALLKQPIRNSFEVGGEYDYCLLELTNEQAVAEAKIDTEKLKAISDRALIITARATRPGYDYVLRYFAPHHGKAEDPATGSANLQVASFWCERLNKTRLHGRQLSKEGGEFIIEVDGDYAWVIGRTKDVRCEM